MLKLYFKKARWQQAAGVDEATPEAERPREFSAAHPVVPPPPHTLPAKGPHLFMQHVLACIQHVLSRSACFVSVQAQAEDAQSNEVGRHKPERPGHTCWAQHRIVRAFAE